MCHSADSATALGVGVTLTHPDRNRIAHARTRHPTLPNRCSSDIASPRGAVRRRRQQGGRFATQTQFSPPREEYGQPAIAATNRSI